MIEVDRKAFLATLGVGAIELMDPEEKAEALEHYMLDQIDESDRAPWHRGKRPRLEVREI